MNKQELVNTIQLKVNEGIIEKSDLYSKVEIEKFVVAFVETVIDTVVSGESVKIVGFGTFEKKPTKGSEGTIQFGERKGEKWTTEDSFKPAFNPSKDFKEKVKG